MALLAGYSGTARAATYSPGIGVLPLYKFDDKTRFDRLDWHVNLATGNLVVHETDLAVQGTGLPLVLDRFYNSQSTDSGSLGSRWSLGTGRDVRLVIQPDGSVIFRVPAATARRLRAARTDPS